jgi:CRISPR-associated protein Cas1
MKHTIEISRQPYHLSIWNGRLQLAFEGEVCSSIPCNEIAMVVVDNAQATYTHKSLDALAAAGAVVVICGSNHLPSSILLPIANHSQVVWRLQDQINCSVARRKRLWQQIVKAKIKSQALNLPQHLLARTKLLDLVRLVASGDKGNLEAQAAKIYWQHWLDDQEFQRDQDGDGLNSFLNYGYAILRATVARAIVAAALTPMLGIHHRHRANAFCLADDLMEPLRAIVDLQVRQMSGDGYKELNQSAKAKLLDILTKKVLIDENEGPLLSGVTRYISSLVSCLSNDQSNLIIPVLC